MAGWFAKLMQQGDAHPRRAIAAAGFSTHGDVQKKHVARDTRYDALIQMLRDREASDSAAREKRQRGYRQSLESDSATGTRASSSCSPVRLHRLRTKVPCRTTPEARALLDELRQRFTGGAVTFPQPANGRQPVMVTQPGAAEPRQVGWIEHCVQTGLDLSTVREPGLSVETDGGSMLVLRFCYPPTAPRMAASDTSIAAGETRDVGFAEIHAALDLRPVDRCPAPRLLWVTRVEAETLNALQSRDYEAFYVRFKRELLAATWSSLSASLSSAPRSTWHRGTHYTVVREADAANARIQQRTVDDGGRAIDIGSGRTYDATSATDILLLHLDTDILADVADIYFTLESLGTSDGYLLKEELFAIVRRFWASARSLTSPCGSELAAVLRMAQGALPMPVQAALLKQDWTNLRQLLVDRYGEGGRRAPSLPRKDFHRPHAGGPRWTFATFTPGDVDIGLRFVYRPARKKRDKHDDESIDGNVEEVVDPVDVVIEGTKRPVDADGCINLGIHALSRDCSEAPRAPHAGGYQLPDHPLEIQDVVLVAEKLPTPAEIDITWVRRHDWILGRALLDESFRDALQTIGHEARNAQVDRKLDAKRVRLYEHLRANILHYQRAIWQQEDPQQRSMRYRSSGKKVPLDWRFELESSAALTIAELGTVLDGPDVNGQFTAYAGGREASLDQLIDPVGPIGYYGNLAIHRMRPELASGELFAMLHFFKSLHLHPDRERRDPDAGDPAQAVSDEDRGGGIAGPELMASRDSVVAHDETVDGWRIILEGGRQMDRLHSVGRRDAEAEWVILRGTGRATAPMLGGGAHDSEEVSVTAAPRKGERVNSIIAGRLPDAAAEWVIAARQDVGVEVAPASTREWRLLANGDNEERPRLVTGAAAPGAEVRSIVPRSAGVFTVRPDVTPSATPTTGADTLPQLDMRHASSLRTGRADAGGVDWVILIRDAGSRKLTQRAGIGAAHAHDRVILAGENDWLRPSLVAGC